LGDLSTRFRLARENKGVSLRRAEQDTRIRRKYLQALEDDDLASLPPAVYVKGFVRNYASYLGLDPNEMLGLYRQAVGESAPKPARDDDQPAAAPPPQATPAMSSVPSVRPPTSPLESRSWLSPNLVIGLGVLIVAILAAWFLLTSSVYQDLIRPTTPSASVVYPTRASTATAAIASPTTFSGETPSPTVIPTIEVEVRASADSYGCWLEVLVDGQEDFRGMLQPGANRTWIGRERIAMHVGNAGGVEAIVNGQPQGPLGAPGQVVDVEWTRPGAGMPPSATPPVTPSPTRKPQPSGTPTITPTPTVPVVTSTPTPTRPPTPTGTPFPTSPATTP